MRARFIARLRTIYSSQKRRAKKYGQTIPYTADELIAAMWPLLAACPYCNAHLTPKGFQIDHRTPLARGGDFSLANCQPVCTPCNRRKHALMHDEYSALLAFVAEQGDFARRNILSRLSAGGAWLAAHF